MKNITLSELKPGIFYLTKGTAEQVQWLTRPLSINPNVLYKPSIDVIREAVEDNPLFGSEERVVIIYPASFTASEMLKTKGRGSNKTLEAVYSDDPYSMPTDNLLIPGEKTYVFVICTDIGGEVTKEADAGIKKLTGSPLYIELNLKNLEPDIKCDKSVLKFHQRYPLTLEQKVAGDYGLLDEETLLISSYEERLIEALILPDGWKEWMLLTPSQIYKYFLLSPAYIRLFVDMRVSNLEIYLRPFLERMERLRGREGYSMPLGEFAYWVYCAHKYYPSPQGNGLSMYRTHARSGPQKGYRFRPSQEAIKEWSKKVGYIL